MLTDCVRRWNDGEPPPAGRLCAWQGGRVAGSQSERRLAAIMFTDIVGYTALMARSEEAGLRARRRHREVVRRQVEYYGGTWIDETGDESLSSFQSATDAVNCALAVNAELRESTELSLRIGIHLGDVLFEGGRVYGDGVNVASRIRACLDNEHVLGPDRGDDRPPRNAFQVRLDLLRPVATQNGGA